MMIAFDIFDIRTALAHSKIKFWRRRPGYLLVRPIGTRVHIWGSDLEQIVISYRIYIVYITYSDDEYGWIIGAV